MGAKKIQISTDGGSTWLNLPGSQGTFTNESEGIDDTILGQTFQSQDVGLITWSVQSDGIFKGFSGYLANILKTGSATAATGEACSLVSGKTYAIDDTAKEIWDRNATVTVYDGASPVSASNIASIDYLFGRVTFVSGYTVTGAVTVDASYFATAAIGKGNAYTLTMSADNIDESNFEACQANGGHRIFAPGLRTVALEIQGIFDASENAKSDLTNRSELICEIDPAGDGSSIARGYFKIMNTEQGGTVGALEEETINFSLTVPDDSTIEHIFNWRHTNSTLNAAIQAAIASWVGELNTYDVRYLPQGAAGQSPLDGVTGDVVFTDITLSGGLSSMNVFNIEMTGTGAYTEV